MNSKLYEWSQSDFIKSLKSAVFVALIAAAGKFIFVEGFDAFNTDYVSLGKLLVNTAIVTFFGRLTERFVTDDRGKVFGKI